MKTALVASSVILGGLLCSCSPAHASGNYENLGTGVDEPRAAPILKAAWASIADFKAGQWSSLHGRMTAAQRAAYPERQIAAQCEMLTGQYGVPDKVEVLEIHVADLPELPANLPGVAMRGIEGHSRILPNPIHLAAAASGHLAFVLCRSTSRGVGLKSWMTLALQQEDAVWKLIGLQMNTCEARGHDGGWFLERARELESRGLHRDAFLYRNLGAQLLMPGAFIFVPTATRILEEGAKQEPPPDLPYPGARPSETWTTASGMRVKVDYVCYVGAPSFLALEVRYTSEQGEPDSPEAKAERRELHEYILGHFPEYKEAFDGIYVGSVTSFGKGFREYFPFGSESAQPPPNSP